jgi:type III secretory pathway component EscV
MLPDSTLWAKRNNHFGTHKITGEKLYISIEDYDEKIHVQNRAEMKNEKNGNYKELTEEFKNILFDNVRNAVENNYVNRTNFMKIIIPISENFYHKKISDIFIKNKFGGFAKFIEQYNIERNDNVIYEPYYRGFSSYKNLKKEK